MNRRLAVTLVAIAAGGWFFWPRSTAAPPAKTAPSDCNPLVFQAKRFTECLAIPGKHRIAMRITGKNGVIYRGFTNLAQDVDSN